MNQADSLRLEEDLRARGAAAAPSHAADLVIVNTCSVTATADQGARQTIRRVARENPSARIVVTGCYATRSADELASLPGVDPRRQKRRQARSGCRPRAAWRDPTAERFSAGDGPCGASLEPGTAGRTAFTLRVQTGCEERCSYCIIPTTRGAGRSWPIAQVAGEVDRIAASGYKEIAITGVHLGSYGRDLQPRSSLAELMRALAADQRRRDVPNQLARADGLHGGGRRPGVRERGPVCAALPSPASARERSRARRDAPALYARSLPAAGRWHRRPSSACVDRLGRHRRDSPGKQTMISN